MPGRALADRTINVAALYAAIIRPPRRDEITAILAARVQEMLHPEDRNSLQAIDGTWADKVVQIFEGLMGLCPVEPMLATLRTAFEAPDSVTARRLRFNFARALPLEYGPFAYSLAVAMLRAAAEASQDPDMVGALVPPRVTLVAPMNRATGVPVDTTVTATFNSPMDATTFDHTTFLLADPSGSLVEARITYDDAANRAVLTPTVPLTAGLTYTARLKGGTTEPTVKDAQGVPLESDQTWPFTTA
jgi:hypothetical protein